jgi:NADPH-dependent curcumin reductase CurA
MTDTQHAWIINHYAEGELKGTELEWVERPVPEPAEGEVLVKTLLLTLDPSNRVWLSEEEDYLPQLQIGDVMRGLVVGQVEASRHPGFAVGDHVFAALGWQEYALVPGDELSPAKGAVRFTPHPDIPLDAYVSALGLTGWTAYVGMKLIGQIKAGDQVLVSGAAGATGMMACQIARAAGARVVGIAGGAGKCELLVNELGMDGCIDYKASPDLAEAIAGQFPDGVDVFFDNVGGPMLDAALENMNIGGRLVISGAISQYQNYGDREALYGVKNTFMLASKRLRMEGFLVLDYLDRLEKILPEMEQWCLDGSLHYQNTEVNGLENAQDALPRLFSGDHVGKLVVRVA